MNKFFQKAFDLYINGSVHVSLAVFALVQMTFYFSKIPFNGTVSAFAFFGTLFSYNFIKYSEAVNRPRKKLSNSIKIIVVLSFISLFIATYCFFDLKPKAQLVALVVLLLSVLYAIPISSKLPNLRNLAGIKIYIVSFCWATVTLILPIINAGMDITTDTVIKFLQRFILILILILIFEIVDLKYDDLKLKTLPQTLGLRMVKRIIVLLLVVFFSLEFFKLGFQSIQAWNNVVIVVLVLYFTLKASPEKSKYFTLFWVESVPIVWWLLIVVENFFR